MKRTKDWANVFVDGDIYTSGFLGLDWCPSDQAKLSKKRYEDWIELTVSKYAKRSSSHAILSAIVKRSPKKVVITPFKGDLEDETEQWYHQQEPVEKQCGGKAVPADAKDASPAGTDTKYCGNDWEHPGDKSGYATGEGSDSEVRFSPWIWHDLGGHCESGAGAAADEILLHELVHSLEQISGKLKSCTPSPDGTGNVAEFYAILLANLYSSETGRKLRRNHRDFTELQKELQTSQAFYEKFKTDVDTFATTYKELAKALKGFTFITFNPFVLCTAV